MSPIKNPEKLESKSEIEGIISQLEEFESTNGAPGAVVKRQNTSLGSSYDLVDLEQAKSQIGEWKGSEIYLKMWDLSFFYDLKNNY